MSLYNVVEIGTSVIDTVALGGIDQAIFENDLTEQRFILYKLKALEQDELDCFHLFFHVVARLYT